ncbi:CASP-like protein 1 [Striga asiatica]|uniref:CASP-like protein n=1 Tax=Striga asiatica TaxID=4170 RepID=A0A5A7QJJ1_STRAF|nr:CASP-like protein 1 [Striga asiatica]
MFLIDGCVLRLNMLMSGPAVHPVEALPPTTEEAPPRIRMKDIQGMAGTSGALALRICQFVFAAVSLCVMATTSDFPSVTAFRYLVAAVGLQSIWSLSLALADTYALLVRRRYRNTGAVGLFAIGDGTQNTNIFDLGLIRGGND